MYLSCELVQLYISSHNTKLQSDDLPCEMRFLTIALLVLVFCPAAVSGAVATTTGFAVISGTFAVADTTCSSTPTTISYKPLGVCIRADGSFKANGVTPVFSYMLSADSATLNIVASEWASSDCSGGVLATGVSLYGTKSICACTASSCRMSSYYIATLPTFIGPIEKTSSYAGSKFCNGTAATISLSPLAMPTSASFGTSCTQSTCSLSTTSAFTTASQRTCVAATDASLPGYFKQSQFTVSELKCSSLLWETWTDDYLSLLLLSNTDGRTMHAPC
jgi:hypothetical protein